MTETTHKSDNQTFRASDIPYYLFATLLALSAVGFIFFIGLSLHYSVTHIDEQPVALAEGIQRMLHNFSHWFDVVFFQYNLILLSIAVAVPPMITTFYVMAMREEKKRRLLMEMPEDLYNDKRYDIEQRIDKIFQLRHYLGSMPMLTLLVLMGGMILLLLKPLPLEYLVGQLGVDYSKGANFLMLGPYMKYYLTNNTDCYVNTLMGTLSAFQFGFLGAYMYFITHLVRSYFTLDLTPNTFVDSSIRMMMGSLLALVCAFLFLKDYPSVIPVLGFCIGFFPQRGLLLIEKASSAVFLSILGIKGLNKRKYATTDLSQLPGMSYVHELRLQREGYDNVENFTHADAVDLAVRTGFNYRQLQNWISQARLMHRLGEDYQDFINATGLSSIADIREFSRNCRQLHAGQEPHEILIAAMKPDDARHKIQIISVLDHSERVDDR